MCFLAPVSEQEPGQRYSSAQSHWFNYRTNMLHLGGHPDQNVAGRLADHELSHFALHCSTPYGLVLDDLCRMQTQLVFGFCARFGVDLEGQKIPRPLYRFARKYGQNPDLLEAHYPDLGAVTSLVHWFIEPWSQSLFLENALEAEGPASDESRLDDDACAAIAAFEEYFLQESRPWPIQAEPLTAERLFGGNENERQFEPVKSLSTLGIEQVPTCCRMAFPRSTSVPLGGFDIFEGVAFLLEDLKGRWNEIELLMSDPDGQRYMSAWTLFATTCPRLKGINQSKYLALVRTFLALCELALYVPIGPVYGRLRHKLTSWLDVQPMYRFIRALDVLEDDEWFCDHNGSDKLQESVCGRLYWAAPSEFIKLGSSLNPVSLSHSRHKDACLLRLNDPWIFSRDFSRNNYFAKFFHSYCPILSYKGSVIPGLENRDNKTLQHFVSKISWRIMMQRGYIWTDDLVPLFTSDERDIRKQELATILEALPFLHPGRFTQINSI